MNYLYTQSLFIHYYLLNKYDFSIRKEREGDREAILAALVCRTFHDHVMVFVQTKKQAHRLHILLGLLGVKVSELLIRKYNSTKRVEKNNI